MTIIHGVEGHPYNRQGDDLYDGETGEWIGRFQGDEVVNGHGQYVAQLVGGRIGRSTSRSGGQRGAGGARASMAGTGAAHAAGTALAGFEDP